ncbi:MAG: hypothetical protein WKG03_05950 [Telluria sp.]
MLMRRKEDLMYDLENMKETIRYCRAYNIILKDKDDEQIAEEFLIRVKDTTGGFKASHLETHEGEMGHAFNAFFVIDRMSPGHIPTEDGLPPAAYTVNFFVRPGRKPLDERSE